MSAKIINQFDESFIPFSEVVEELGDIEGRLLESIGMENVQMDIEKVNLGLPLQLEILVHDSGQINLGGVPPLHYVETSFTPIFHQIKLTLTVNE